MSIVCDICYRPFASRYSLKRHNDLLHSQDDDDETSEPETEGEETREKEDEDEEDADMDEEDSDSGSFIEDTYLAHSDDHRELEKEYIDKGMEADERTRGLRMICFLNIRKISPSDLRIPCSISTN